MTPTEQDNELRELVHMVQNADTTYDAMQFITADRKRVALEARIDENNIFRLNDHFDWKCRMWSEGKTSSSIGKNLYWEFTATKKEIGMENIPFLVRSATGNTFAILDGIQTIEWKALKKIQQQERCRLIQMVIPQGVYINLQY